MDLQDFRKEIDRIDKSLVELFSERLDISEQVAQYKIDNDMRVLDAKREKEKLASVAGMLKDPFRSRSVRELFEQIMTISRKRQYQLLGENGVLHGTSFIEVDSLFHENMRIVYQGAEGSYSELAVKMFFGEDTGAMAVETFRDAMTALEEGAADYAVLPIENSTAGIVSENYDLLSSFENYIVGEQIVPIRHCLMAPEGARMETIQTVYSHPQSLMQSERFLAQHPSWNLISMKNNAFAARKVAEDGDVTQAAVAGENAARRYGLAVLAEGVNEEEDNSTRFIVVSNRKIFRKDAKKISLCLETVHEAGALYRVLSHFIFNNLNMTGIESRPIRERSWEYRFFIDFEGNMNDPAVRNAIRGIREEARSMRVLGNY
ncbi:MAG: prephenate dehydratase [Lachnospiraceae bacterium]|nr:prephenate dehydratase [Lachnospiraceae bacterium]